MRELGSVIRDFRRTAGLTQAQLAVAMDIAPTSIYRYEAGMTKPDLRTIQKLYIISDKYGDDEAKRHFLRELEENSEALFAAVPGSSGTTPAVAESSSLGQLLVGDQPLNPRERLLVIAFVLMLRNNVDESSEKMMKLLLEPWMRAAKDQFDQR
ncbi:MAG TPA: helix-turn-helix transcriptional regulator [Bryobacteraceae bacterium]|nr:helix-turn-helix transcriptional regulator [Bryobacteraceae bacterium]